jgi:hypothetical protein
MAGNSPVGDTQRLVDDRPPHRREVLDFLGDVSELQSSGSALHPILRDPAFVQPEAIVAQPKCEALQSTVPIELLRFAVGQFETGDRLAIEDDPVLMIHQKPLAN